MGARNRSYTLSALDLHVSITFALRALCDSECGGRLLGVF